MKLSSDDFVAVATVGKPSGLKGACCFFPIGSTLLDSSLPISLWIGNENAAEKIVLREISGSQNAYRCFFDACSDRDGAEKLKNSILYIEKERLPELEDGEFYFRDLIGISVESESGNKLGIVRDVFNYPASDAFDVEMENGEKITIPFTEEIVRRISVEEKRMIVDKSLIEELIF